MAIILRVQRSTPPVSFRWTNTFLIPFRQGPSDLRRREGDIQFPGCQKVLEHVCTFPAGWKTGLKRWLPVKVLDDVKATGSHLVEQSKESRLLMK